MAMKQAALKAEKPTGEEVTAIEVFEAPPPSESASKRSLATPRTT